MLTFALDDIHSFKNLDVWYKEFLHYADVQDFDNFPFLIIGNKSDIEDNMREITEAEAKDWCSNHGDLPYLETSAKTASNVTEAFSIAVQRWVEMESKMERPVITGTIDLNKENPSRCCF